jgi:UDP-2,3-diacylglucosamine pyrophosphatase LpxH
MANTFLSIPAESLPQFDELYVISDLHMGGAAGHQMFNSGTELARLIRYLKARLPDSKVALLINGDFVDFLAEPDAKHFDPAGAVRKLNRIATEDSAFKKVFGALKDFAKTPNRRLIINLGNHDLELALPWARARLLEILTGGDEAAYARITCSFEGTGFPCKVGNATVLCVHGNEVDTWNVADYEMIRRFGLEVIHGRPIDSWIPNAGSKLVIDVMNSIKHKYPFVDLLKPETAAMIPTLLALAPDQHDKLNAIAATARRFVLDSLKIATGFLGKQEEQELKGRTLAATDVFTSGSSSISRGFSKFEREDYASSLLDNAEARFLDDVDPMALVNNDQLGSYLGLTGAIKKWFFGADKTEVLREAFSDLGQDRSFDPTADDATSNDLDEKVGDGFDFLIAGHTHLARALTRRKKSGWYFNSGTWARLIRFEDKVINDPEAFKKVFEAFSAGSMEALDSFPDLVMRILTVVAIRADGKMTHGELLRANLAAKTDDQILPLETDYRFTKS